ncbi:MAG: hypothetical protein RRY95_00635 [Oscillospiraceae bacterium]
MENKENIEKSAAGIAIDMNLIRSDLSEQDCIPGAFCQDYEMFKLIYRFMARRLARTKGNSYLILLTLTDCSGSFPSLVGREEQMSLLGEIIQSALRLGDVFTQYSSCQFLLMVPDASEEESNKISARIHDLFFIRNEASDHRLLLHSCYPMLPAAPQKTITPADEQQLLL